MIVLMKEEIILCFSVLKRGLVSYKKVNNWNIMPMSFLHLR